jgi:hypothetical protein
MSVTVIRYAERPELWEHSDALSRAVWPEYNQHGDVLNRYWGRLLEDFPSSSSSCTTTGTGCWPRATPCRVLGMGPPRDWVTGSTQ